MSEQGVHQLYLGRGQQPQRLLHGHFGAQAFQARLVQGRIMRVGQIAQAVEVFQPFGAQQPGRCLGRALLGGGQGGEKALEAHPTWAVGAGWQLVPEQLQHCLILAFELGPAMALRNVRAETAERGEVVDTVRRLGGVEGGQVGERQCGCGQACSVGFFCRRILIVGTRQGARRFQIARAAVAQPLLAGAGKLRGLVAELHGGIGGQGCVGPDLRTILQQVGLQRLAIGKGQQCGIV